MYTKNIIGPRIDPGKTPYSIILSDELVLVIETNCFYHANTIQTKIWPHLGCHSAPVF